MDRCPASNASPAACIDARQAPLTAFQVIYYAAARKRIRAENLREAEQGFVQAERSWMAYRDAECNSVFDYWSAGTIRVSMDLDCRIRLTRLRTFAIWRNWLTYPDHTPPLLPRPEVEAVTSAR